MKKNKILLITAIFLIIASGVLIPITALSGNATGFISSFIIIPIIDFIAFILIVIVVGSHIRNTLHKNLDNENEIAENVRKQINNEKEDKKTAVMCEYCGTIYHKENNNCPHCGASKRK